MAKNRKLNVGLVFDDSLDSNDGVAQYVKTLGSWLAKQGHHVSYLVGETKIRQWHGGKVYSLAKNQTVVFNGNKLSMPVSPNLKLIKETVSRENFDVIHVMVPYSPFMAAKVIKTASPGTAIVGTFHIFPSGRLSKAGSRLLGVWLKPTLKLFGKFVSVSTVAAEFAKEAYGISSSVIPNPVDTAKFSVTGSKNKTNEIVFLGRLVKRKGAEQLIRALKQLLDKVPEAELTIAGDGPERENLVKLAKKLGIDDRVKFLGFIDEADKPRLLSCADVACFPSLYGESFGIVLVEAMAAGAGVVLGGNNPGYSSVLSEQPLMLIDARDTSAFAERLDLLLSDKNRSAALHAWQSEAVKQYDIKVVGEQILDLYNGQIARKHKTGNNKAHE